MTPVEDGRTPPTRPTTGSATTASATTRADRPVLPGQARGEADRTGSPMTTPDPGSARDRGDLDPEQPTPAPTSQEPGISATGDAPSTSAAPTAAAPDATSGQPLPGGPTAAPAAPGLGRLFGRDLLYVVIWSFQLLSSVLISPVLARILGPAEFGLLATAIAVYQILIVLAVIGFDRAISLQRAEDGDDHAARKLLTVGALLSVAVAVLVGLTGWVWSPAIGFDGYSELAFVVVLWTAPGAVVMMVLAMLMAADRMPAFAAVSILSSVGGPVVGIVLLLAGERNATTYAWGGVICQGAAMIVGLLLARPALRGAFDRVLLGRALQVGIPVAISGLTLFVLNASDRIVIQRMLGSVEVGRYQVAYTVGYVVVLLLGSVSQAWTPRIAAVRDEQQRWDLIGRSRDELYLLLAPMVLGVTLVAPIGLRIVAPADYDLEPLLLVVFLVAVSAFPVAAAGASQRALLTGRRTRPLAWAGLLAAASNIALNIALIPFWGITGSAVATVLAFALQGLLQRLLLPRTARWPRAPRQVPVLIGVAVVIAAGSVLIPQTLTWNLVRAAAALACAPWFLLRLRASRKA
ncbi:hypothetical protein GCM10009818_16330 [Nakamurella flavida]